MAQIDASIPLQVQRPRVTSPLEQYAQIEQLRSLQGQGQLREMQMQEFQDKRARQQNLRSILGQGLQGQDLVKALQTGGYLDEATAYAKQLREEQDSSLKREGEIVKLQGDLAKYVMSNPSEQAAIGAIERMEAATGRRFDSERAAVYSMRNDPAALRKWAAGHALSAEQQLPKFQQFDTGGQVQMGTVSPFGEYAQTGAIDKTVTPDAVMTDKRTREEGAANRAVTVRGQNLTDARAREIAAATREQGGKPPVGYRWSADGRSLEPIQGGPADKPPGKALPASMANKVLENRENFAKVERALSAIGENKDSTGWKGYLPDAVLQRTDPKGVEARAAIGDLGSMIIHDRSGAAVTAAEFPRLRPFIPSVTDDPATVEKKVRRFAAEYEAVMDENEAFYRDSGYNVPERRKAGKSGASGAVDGRADKPELGARVDGYIYKGGDPANPSSWEKER